MIRKIRRRYYRCRDRGKGKQFISCAIFASLALAVLSGGLIIGIIRPFLSPGERERGIETETPAETAPVEEKKIEVEELQPFLSFMKDESYAELIEDVTDICSEKGYDRVEKLEHQDVGESELDVISYLKFPDGSIMSFAYNLNTGEYLLEETSLSENDILEKELQTEEPASEPTPEPAMVPAVPTTMPPTATPAMAAAPAQKPSVTKKPNVTVKKKKAHKKEKPDKKRKVIKKPKAEKKSVVKRPVKNNNQKGSVGSDTATIR